MIDAEPYLPVGEVVEGDNLDVMARMPDNSIDAICTDPPYGLEFMGKEWDKLGWQGGGGFSKPGIGERDTAWPSFSATSRFGTANPTCATCGGRLRGAKKCSCETPEWQPIGKRRNPENEGLPDDMTGGGMTRQMSGMQEWHERWAREAYRIAKPGAYLLAFGGTRTYHRLASAIEDAGWEIRDTLVWAYACLSDDTEILTEQGWARYHNLNEGHLAAAFDIRTGQLRWEAVEGVHVYAHQGPMVEVGPQLVTLNHRVVLEASREPQVPLPSDEALRGLWVGLPRLRSVSGSQGQDVLQSVSVGNHLARTEGQEDAHGASQGAPGDVRDVRQGVLAATSVAQGPDRDLLFASMQRQTSRTEPSPQRSGPLQSVDGGAKTEGARSDERGRQSSLEGRSYRVQEARELLGSAVRSGSGVGRPDGAQGRIRHGAPAADGQPVRLPDDSYRSGQPREPRSDRQSGRESDALARQPSPQALRVGEVHRRDSGENEVRLVDYSGVVWCITVPSGAFVARRNGVVFVTGNSGFPKSLDVSKAIDKAAGAEREVVGQRTLKGNAAVSTQEKGGTYVAGANFTGVKDIDVTTAATDDAKKWAGWGTALKPAWEPIVMARKPLSGTVASNVLRYGTGAINIDATRIATEENLNGGAYAEDPTERWDGTENWRYKRGIGRSTLPGDEREGAALGMLAEGKVTGKEFVQPEGRWPANVILTDPILDGGFEGVVGGGERASGVMKGGTQRNSRSVDYGKMPDTATLSDTYGDSGGASRFFLIPKAARSEREPNWHGIQEEFEDEEPTNTVGPMAGRGQPGYRCLKCGKWKVSGSPCVCPEPEWEQIAFNRPKIFNSHTTVKPLDLMIHLVRLVCPAEGIVLDPFLGSGTTAKAAEMEGRRWIGIEQDEHYAKIARARLNGAQRGLGL